jgi:aldose 1-epimerase
LRVRVVSIEAQSERALIVPELGCNCLGYRVSSLEVIAGPVGPDEWRAHPFSTGIPILFPWPGRIADARFEFAGRAYRVPVNEPARGHALHGLTWNRPFRVTRQAPYFVRAEIDSRIDAELGRHWPWPFTLELDYEVGGGLRIRATVRNTGDAPMPFGFGAHPYFHLPLGASGERGAMRLELAAESRWPLDARLIPTGGPERLAGKFALRGGRALGAETYDDAFHMEGAGDASRPRARLIDPALKLAIELRADPAFREFVVYAPADRRVIAVEPYTCGPDAFNLAARGIDSGARTLEPGESFAAGFEIKLSAP